MFGDLQRAVAAFGLAVVAWSAGEGVARACLTTLDCPAAAPVCDLLRGACVTCADNADCASHIGVPFCVAPGASNAGACVACLSPAHCGGTTPFCDPSNTCVACLRDADCPANAPVCSALRGCEPLDAGVTGSDAGSAVGDAEAGTAEGGTGADAAVDGGVALEGGSDGGLPEASLLDASGPLDAGPEAGDASDSGVEAAHDAGQKDAALLDATDAKDARDRDATDATTLADAGTHDGSPQAAPDSGAIDSSEPDGASEDNYGSTGLIEGGGCACATTKASDASRRTSGSSTPVTLMATLVGVVAWLRRRRAE